MSEFLWVYLSIAFGVILSLRDASKMVRVPMRFPQAFSRFFMEGVELCWYSLALLLIHFLVLHFKPEVMVPYEALLKYPVFWLGGFLITTLTKRTKEFFVIGTMICFLANAAPQGSLGILWFFESIKVSFAIALVHFFIDGSKRHLVFAAVPETVRGIPVLASSALVLCLLASSLLIIFS